ncbi:MAG: 23S rRNA (adenine(2503)-C(2))-methyltransferase RlmN [Bacillota bacterium]|nr:23S rRNA (adenine(2503)-C(2))-methyltransferase RlmN [Bacillota bacterium]
MIDLLSLREQDIVDLMTKNGFPGFRGKQIFQWCQEKGIKNFDNMRNLPDSLQVWLKENAKVGFGKIADTLVGDEGNTVKFLIKLPGEKGNFSYIETVLMCYGRVNSRQRNTVCVSTQAGCGMGCKFCASALGGLDRNLTAGEIVEQVWLSDNYLKKKNLSPVTNVVFMGMGEPLNNFNELMKAVTILNEGKNIGMRRMTVSTAGVVPKISDLAVTNSQINMAVSLHAPNDELRNKLMPINKKYPLSRLVASIDDYIAVTNRRVTIEYALFKDVNDSDATALELADLLKGKLVKVNLLRGNPVKETDLLPPDLGRVEAFGEILEENGIETMIRESRGRDINGACGQLRKKIL